MDKILLNRLLRGCSVLLICVAMIYSLYIVTPLVYPFILAWIIAYILNPFVNFLQKTARLPRWFAVTFSLFIFMGSMLTIVSAVITRIIIEVFNLSQLLEGSIGNWKRIVMGFVDNQRIQHFVAQLSTLYEENPNMQDTINKNIEKTAQTVTNAVSDVITSLFNSILHILSSLPNIATILMVILLSVFFISKDWVRLMEWVKKWIPHRARQPAGMVWADLQKALYGYVRAQFIIVSMTAIVVMIGLLVIRVPYAITIGLLIGLLDLLPYLGVGAAMIPWIVYTFISGNDSLGIALSILYCVILVARQIIEPKVLATSVGLNPFATLIVMYVGLQLFGVLGLIIGPVTLVIAQAVQRANVFRDIWTFILRGSRQ